MRDLIINALEYLPAAMRGMKPTAFLLAIGLQESELKHRTQHDSGPARGLWQFERIGVQEVFRHPATRELAQNLCWQMGYASTTAAVYHALANDDWLACCFARLALWRLPESLPSRYEPDKGWAQYLKVWAPGKPRPEKWRGNWSEGWEMAVGGGWEE